jgi:hypothetical protein
MAALDQSRAERDALVKADTGRDWGPDEPTEAERARAEQVRRVQSAPRVTGIDERGYTVIDCAQLPEERWEQAGSNATP